MMMMNLGKISEILTFSNNNFKSFLNNKKILSILFEKYLKNNPVAIASGGMGSDLGKSLPFCSIFKM